MRFNHKKAMLYHVLRSAYAAPLYITGTWLIPGPD